VTQGSKLAWTVGIQKMREMTGKKISRCNSCGKYFDSKRELRKHIDKKHRITDSKISESRINKYDALSSQ
jgi:uncharacterized C2H2 Zn-finger protein